jgi:hypothetical protein
MSEPTKNPTGQTVGITVLRSGYGAVPFFYYFSDFRSVVQWLFEGHIEHRIKKILSIREIGLDARFP